MSHITFQKVFTIPPTPVISFPAYCGAEARAENEMDFFKSQIFTPFSITPNWIFNLQSKKNEKLKCCVSIHSVPLVVNDTWIWITAKVHLDSFEMMTESKPAGETITKSTCTYTFWVKGGHSWTKNSMQNTTQQKLEIKQFKSYNTAATGAKKNIYIYIKFTF